MAESIEFYTNDIRDRLGEDSGLNATIKFDFKGDGYIHVDGKSVPNQVTNEDRPADCTLVMKFADFQKLSDGKLNAGKALLFGKIKVKGNMLVARKLAPIMGESVD